MTVDFVLLNFIHVCIDTPKLCVKFWAMLLWYYRIFDFFFVIYLMTFSVTRSIEDRMFGCWRIMKWKGFRRNLKKTLFYSPLILSVSLPAIHLTPILSCPHLLSKCIYSKIFSQKQFCMHSQFPASKSHPEPVVGPSWHHFKNSLLGNLCEPRSSSLGNMINPSLHIYTVKIFY
jgi:hypothetical protein